MRGTRRAMRGTRRAMRGTRRAMRGTRRAMRGTRRAMRGTRRAMRGTRPQRADVRYWPNLSGMANEAQPPAEAHAGHGPATAARAGQPIDIHTTAGKLADLEKR